MIIELSVSFCVICSVMGRQERGVVVAIVSEDGITMADNKIITDIFISLIFILEIVMANKMANGMIDRAIYLAVEIPIIAASNGGMIAQANK